MIKLYGFAVSNYYNMVKLALLEKGVPFEEVPFFAGQSPEALAISPRGKIPVLGVDQGFINETSVILEYLEQTQPGKKLLPTDPFERAQALARHPLRDDALRTPDAAFADLPGYPWAPHYISDLPSLAGLRMHYLDEGPQQAPRTWLCLHGNPSWSYLYRHMLPVFLAAGDRVVAPDLIGFGKSDKPKKDGFHQFAWHRQVLLELVDRLDLRNTVLVVQDWGGILGLTLPMDMPGRFAGLLVMNTMLATGDAPLPPGFAQWREMCAKKPLYSVARLFARGNPHLISSECAAYDAPFPDRGYRAALRAFPALVPGQADAEGAAVSRAARDFWQHDGQGRSLMAVGVQDPVLGMPAMQALQRDIRGCPPPIVLPQAGHFVPEHGQALALQAVEYFRP